MARRTWRTWRLSRRRTATPTPWTCCRTMSISMIGRTEPEARERRRRLKVRWGYFCCGWGVSLWLTAAAAQSPPSAPPPSPPATTQPPQSTRPSDDPPDDELIEFLGGDDVGDAAWWEFL